MKDLVSQDYIDYQDGRDHFRYFGQPVDPLGIRFQTLTSKLEPDRRIRRWIATLKFLILAEWTDYVLKPVFILENDTIMSLRHSCSNSIFRHDRHESGP